MAGSCRLRRNTAAKNAAAQMIEMNSRINFAGITALRSVYVAPVKSWLRSLNSSSYLSK